MANIEKSEIIRRYANVILTVATCKEILDRAEQELSLIKETLQEDIFLLEFLKNPQISAEEKRKVVIEIFKGVVSSIILHQIALVVGVGRGGLLLSIIDRFLHLADELNKKTRGKITTSIPISKETKDKFQRIISELIGKEAILKNTVDPSILGGFILQIDDKIIDASIQGQLGRLREEISKEIAMPRPRRSPLCLEQARLTHLPCRAKCILPYSGRS